MSMAWSPDGLDPLQAQLKLDRVRSGAARALMAGVLALCAQPALGDTLRLGHITPPSHVWHKVAERLASELDESSGGGMKVKIYPLQRLGTEAQMIQLMQSGAVHLGVLTVAGLSNRVPSLLAWSLPYAFRDVEHATMAANTTTARAMLEQLEPHGLVGLGYAFAGMRHVLALQPVHVPRDLAKRRIRSFPSPLYNDWWRAVGAAPTALPLSEVSPSLTTRLLHAVDVDLDVLVGLKFHHQAPYLALTNHMAFPAAIVVSKRWWDTLGDGERALVRKAVARAEAWGKQAAIAAEQRNLRAAAGDGAKVVHVDLAAFATTAEGVRARYLHRDPLVARFYAQVGAL